ncbi:MAG: hypothetical protein JSU94_09910 [Phycisphaerales bacterium]|nr:MAG: hypothetical protein JSU94_09910 [Phycisphaerales bacterium]
MVGSAILVLFTTVLGGCRKSGPRNLDERTIERISISFCQDVMKDPACSERARSVAQQVLKQRLNDTVDPKPVLVDVHFREPRGGHLVLLAVGVSDEDGDLGGLVVRERHKDQNGQTAIIEEVYPVFAHIPFNAAMYFFWRVKLREAGERKNEEQWQAYIDAGIADIEAMPPVCVSVPQPGKIDVEVWVYDNAGHNTEAVAVANRLSGVGTE